MSKVFSWSSWFSCRLASGSTNPKWASSCVSYRICIVVWPIWDVLIVYHANGEGIWHALGKSFNSFSKVWWHVLYFECLKGWVLLPTRLKQKWQWHRDFYNINISAFSSLCLDCLFLIIHMCPIVYWLWSLAFIRTAQVYELSSCVSYRICIVVRIIWDVLIVLSMQCRGDMTYLWQVTPAMEHLNGWGSHKGSSSPP